MTKKEVINTELCSNKTFCPYPWNSLSVKLEHTISVCCYNTINLGDINSVSLIDAFNTPEMKQLRVDLLTGVQNESCATCNNREAAGGKSLRVDVLEHAVNRDYYHKAKKITLADGTLDKIELRLIDIRFNNLRNFKCRTCCSDLSSSIQIEEKRFFNHAIKKINVTNIERTNFFDDVRKQYDYVTTFYFAGGEILLQKEHYAMLEELIHHDRADQFELIYSTNGSTLSLHNVSVLDIWPKFRTVRVQMSIDGYGAGEEYWRDGSNFDDQIDKLKQIDSLSNTVVAVHSTISWANVFSWIEFIKFWIKQRPIGDDNLWNLTLSAIDGPPEFALYNAPQFKKDQINAALSELSEFVIHAAPISAGMQVFLNELAYLRTAVMLPPKLENLDFSSTVQLDKIRGQDFFKAFPEHEDMRPYFDK